MASLKNPNFQTQFSSDDSLVTQITEIHSSISKLESLKPSKEVNTLFTRLVRLCTLSSTIDINALTNDAQTMRESLIVLCGQSEGLLELEFSTVLTKIPKPLEHLNMFPYYDNYVKLAKLEYKILTESGVLQPKKVAFVGSGPMPLTSIILATHHMKTTCFDNFDIDEVANRLAREMVSSDPELEKRMKFVTRDIMEMKEELVEYDCIFLAALVGLSLVEKMKIVAHLRKYMKGGGYLLVRSAKGGRAFLYPVVEEHHLKGFEVLSVFHPTNEVINSVILAQKQLF